jgi:ABC-type dipeptide/oligopeptide/nickel transport system ATPase component
LDVSQAQQLVYTASETIPDLERQIQQQENVLSVLLGENPESIPRGRALTEQPVPENVPAGLPSELLERRPDVRQAEGIMVAANAQIGVAKASFFPNLSLTGLGGLERVELLFLPSVYTPCPTCHGARYNTKTLQIKYRDKNIAEVLRLTVDGAFDFFSQEPQVLRSLDVLRQVGLGYLRLGQPATELSGGEAQRIKLATELQRSQHGNTLYILDEPTTGLHPEDVEKLIAQLDRLVEAGNTVIVIEHDMRVVAASDWVIDIGPGAGDEGGRIVASGPPADVSRKTTSRTAAYLKRFLDSYSAAEVA